MTQLNGDFLLPSCPGLKLLHLQKDDQSLGLSVISTSTTALCPVCQTPSEHVHCYYTRTITDLCWTDIRVRIELHVRRFVCPNALCFRRTFAERLGEQIKAYARRTKRCEAQLQSIALLLGGNAGARLATILGIAASSDTLLRLVRATEVPHRSTPRVLGIDDFALRKGENYGTILVDLEHRHLVDLLPDREKETVSAWLKAHPGVEVVSRDRASAYTEAVREAAPKAIQVADRFHLSQNLGETVERMMRRDSPRVKQILGEGPQAPQSAEEVLPFQRHEAEKQASQLRRMAVYEQVLSLHEQGYNQSEIAKQLAMDSRRVQQFLKGPPQPPLYKQRSVKLAPYKAFLTRRFEEGCDNSLQLYREMCAQGYTGCSSIVTNYVTQLRQQAGVPAGTGRHQVTQPKPLKEKLPAPSQMRWWFLLPRERLRSKQQEQLTQLCESEAEFALMYQLTQAFVTLLHQHTEEGLTEWLEQVQRSSLAEVQSFAKGLIRDEAAVRAGLSLKWSHDYVA